VYLAKNKCVVNIKLFLGMLQFYDRGNLSAGTINHNITVAVFKIVVIPPQAVFACQNSFSPMLLSHSYDGT
jgi:hypothetical protein